MNNTNQKYHCQSLTNGTRFKYDYHNGNALYDSKGVKEVV